MASSSSSLPLTWRYNVFVSFHGPDVPGRFVSHLRRQFRENGITMFYDEEIERGQIITPALIEAIRGSRIAILLLSKKYASSGWCLDELLEILECKEAIGQIVMTIFYGVEPSDVRNQRGEFGIAFKETCDGKTEEKKRRWSQALNDAATIAGEHFKNWGDNEVEKIEKIAKDISNKLHATPSRDFDGVVGLEAHLRKMESLLHLSENLDATPSMIVGICGPAGIGKSTIARALHSLHSTKFQLTCFVDNLNESYPGVIDKYSLKLILQAELLAKVLNLKDFTIGHLGVLQERLENQRVLIILDDVKNITQLEALANEFTWFGPGSRIVITTENKELLQQHGINNIYHVKFPSDDQALKILCRYAFRQSYPRNGFEKLAGKVVELCGKLPLGLHVVGSSLRGKNEEQWKGTIRRLDSIFDQKDIEEVLNVVYESLHENEKSLFVHIATFFNYDDGVIVEHLLAENRNNLDIKQGLKILANKSLIYFSTDGKIVMHKLLQQVGRSAIRRGEPWKRKILVDAEDIRDILEGEDDIESREVASILFDTSRIKEVFIKKRAFKRMKKLRFLKVINRNDSTLHIPEEMELPRRLMFFHWKGYPGKAFPRTVNMEYIVELNMQYSKLEKLWEGILPLTNLKKMDLEHSVHLKELPDFSNATNLERLVLNYCFQLVEIPSSIGNLQKLKTLEMQFCVNLQVVPTHLNLVSLESVYTFGCFQLRKFPDCFRNITKLTITDAMLQNLSESVKLSSHLRNLLIYRDHIEILSGNKKTEIDRIKDALDDMIDDVTDRMEEHAQQKLNPFKTLNNMKISMMYIEWYIKDSKKANIGYYDRSKTQTASPTSVLDNNVKNHKKELNDYWQWLVKEVEKKPHSDLSILRRRFLFSGNNYRRIIEPLDIAEYYEKGGKEYSVRGRSHHYVMLEKWFKEESLEPTRSEKSDLSNLLTYDSCFWAEVEEAMIVINQLKTIEGMIDKELIGKLVKFEEYVWYMIQNREVSPEIFLEKSSFMKWWKEYKEIITWTSPFIEFMNARHYKSYGLRDLLNREEADSLECARIQDKTPLVAQFQNAGLTNEDGELALIVVDGNALYPLMINLTRMHNLYHNILKVAKEKAGEEGCVVVFSCNDNIDVEETSFIMSILKELHEREVTPLIYNLSGRENLDGEMLCISSVGIIVLSDSFARCSKSLDHLVVIMEHVKATNLVIIPVYFKVTHADICGVDAQFETVPLQHLNSVEADRVQNWKKATTELASINGHEWTRGTQSMVAEEVVRNACLRLHLKNSKNLVRILTMINRSQPSDTEIVGIWGMAGIGKTSIAREIFGILAPQYDWSYCLQNFDRSCEEKGLRRMRDVFYSEVFGGANLSIGASDAKPSFMRDLFLNKKILIVLDDVSNAKDAEYVVGGFGWFSRGHRIILTSRRKQVLVQCKVEEPYEINRLCEFESLRLCKQFLNGEESGIISELMSCASGIPLALEVLGSSVSKLHVNDMMVHLQSLRINPPTQIRQAFERCFDGLDENERNIFLDLACFFQGVNKDHVVQLLDACGFFTSLGICNLIDESLISLLNDKIEIPIPFQDMGRFLVRQEDVDPCKRSRLWDVEDIIAVLTENSGTEAIEGIFLDTSNLTCDLSPTVFCEMDGLRLLKFYSSNSGKESKLNLRDGLDILPDELRLLHWEHYPLKYLPQQFDPENLVEINMPHSNMEKLWEGKKNLEKLKKIRLSHSRKLTDILILSEALNLEHIDLEGCTSLRSLPFMVDLTHLEHLNLSGCSELEEILDFGPNLKELFLAGTAIRELPLSVANLSALVTLDLENCISLQQLPKLRSNIDLNISGCKALASPNKASVMLRSNTDVNLAGCSSLESVPKHKPRVMSNASQYKAVFSDSVKMVEDFLTQQRSKLLSFF